MARGKGRELVEEVHLLRGSPVVRSWSKHQRTVPLWTLCGIKRRASDPPQHLIPKATEFDAVVTCRSCRQLIET